MAELIRLQKYIAHQGICSRRKAEALIEEGKVKINDRIVDQMGMSIDPDKDTVAVQWGRQWKVIEPGQPEKKEYVYVMLNKPLDYICTTTHQQGDNVLDLIREPHFLYQQKKEQVHTRLKGVRLYPVGRLDKDSEGLVLLTNDGDLTEKLTHPRYQHEKEYELVIDTPLDNASIKLLERGMSIGDEMVRGIEIVKNRTTRAGASVHVILREGKNRQIKKMFGRLGYRVKQLKRVRIGRLRLASLPLGRWKFIEKSDIV